MKYTERVSVISGDAPILVVAPHGYDGDDERTALVTEYIANNFGTYAIINRGWERNDSVDYMLDKADCNNVIQCHEDVVKEEFLEPIIRFKNRILAKHAFMYMFLIHGMANRHRIITQDHNLDMVVGFGAGSPNSFTTELWRKNAFIHFLSMAGIHAYEGAKNGPMSGWARNNMNQLFKKWYEEPDVHSMQIEIIHELRSDDDMAKITATYLGESMIKLLQATSFSSSHNIKSY